jgi:hypothetical protein
LAGTWKGQDQGSYYVRQIGNNILCVGMSPDKGRTWTNIFVGKINGDEMKVGDTISGKRADVPRRKIQGSGTLTLIVKGEWSGNRIFMQKTVSTGSPFGGSTWCVEKISCIPVFILDDFFTSRLPFHQEGRHYNHHHNLEVSKVGKGLELKVNAQYKLLFISCLAIYT